MHHVPGVYSTSDRPEDLSGGKAWSERKADNLTAICEPIV
jgi:hypothetical protein